MPAKITVGMLTYELTTVLKNNAPVRDGAKYPGPRGASPYPGNLKLNGIQTLLTNKASVCEVGHPNAPYAPYTELHSRKKGWQKKSNIEFIKRIQSLGLEVMKK